MVPCCHSTDEAEPHDERCPRGRATAERTEGTPGRGDPTGAARSGQALHPAAVVAGWMETLPPDQAAFSSGPTPFLCLAITCDLTGRCRTCALPGQTTGLIPWGPEDGKNPALCLGTSTAGPCRAREKHSHRQRWAFPAGSRPEARRPSALARVRAVGSGPSVLLWVRGPSAERSLFFMKGTASARGALSTCRHWCNRWTRVITTS